MLHIQDSQPNSSPYPRFPTNKTIRPIQFGTQHQPESKTSIWDALAIFGNGVMLLNGFLRLLMPLINKNAAPLAQFILRMAPKISPSKARQLNTLLASQEKLSNAIKRMFLFGMFFQGINTYQTAVNTRQPSLITNAILRDAISLLGIFYPTNFVFTLYFLVSTFLCIGKRTDIENSNHPGYRRDWDFKRLTRFFSQKNTPSQTDDSVAVASFGQELKSFGGFIAQDFRDAFSLKHWRTLKENYRQKSFWKPQSYQSALAAQFCALTWLLGTIRLFKKTNSLAISGAISAFLAELMFDMPLFNRALQNRTDLDGKLVLAGTPLMIIGNSFDPQFTQKFFFLGGLSSIGSALHSRGLILNSKQYRALINTLETLHAQALQNPQLNANSILDYLQKHPNSQKQLQKKIGHSRAQFLLNVLQDASKAQREQGTPLATFLAPLSQAHERHWVKT